MGQFHKKVIDIIEMIKKKDYKGAEKQLKKHIEAEHGAEKDIALLTRDIQMYQAQLRAASNLIKSHNKLKKKDKIYIKESLNHLNKAEERIKAFKMTLSRLVKEEKIKLE